METENDSFHSTSAPLTAESHAKRNTHGCCADKACTDKTCMELPAGKTCGHCVHVYRCTTMFGHTPTDTYCDWFPRRFNERLQDSPLSEAQRPNKKEVS
jgi:hypothetical protein